MKKSSRFLQDLATRVAAGLSVRAAAAEIGCSERQGYTIAATMEFRELVSKLKTESIQRAAAILADAATRAASVLSELLNSEDEKTKLAAAVKILSTLAPLSEFVELRKRVDDLEKSQPWKVAR